MGLIVDVKKHYKGFDLSVSFNNEGNRLGILGASGSGKSVLLKCIAGIVTPDEGKIVLGDRPLFDATRKINIKPQMRKIGFLFQNYALFPHMTVAENIGIGLSKTDPYKLNKVSLVIEKFHLKEIASKYPRQISGGQQQRVALARCMIVEPEILLLDEPFSALDDHLKDNLQMEVMAYLSDFKGDVLLVSHSRDEIYRMSEALMVMDKGKANFMGETHEAFKHPKHKYVAKLTGCKNFSDVKRTDEAYFATEWGVHIPLKFADTDIKYFGIRAHDFIVHPRMQVIPEKLFFTGRVKRMVEDIFELTFYIKPNHPSVPEDTEIICKISKAKWGNQPVPDDLTLEIPLDRLIPLIS